MPTINELYFQTANALASKVAEALNGEVHSVVLYGSTARGEARRSSDIDVLILSDHPDAHRKRVVEIEDELDAENGYRTLLVSMYFTVNDFRRLSASSSPFARAVLKEGIILYDDGSFAGVRDQVLGDGGGDAGRRKAHAI